MSVRRSKQFAIIQPSPKTRLDLGINLKGVPPSGRLEASGSFNAMVSHRLRLESPADVDKDVKGWRKAAYDQASVRAPGASFRLKKPHPDLPKFAVENAAH